MEANQTSVDGESVESVLNELHEKKRWLDMMIEGLEAALDSPQHQLIELTKKTFEKHEGPAPRVDLEQTGKAQLASLARSVGKTAGSGRPQQRNETTKK